jgi:hypothetical protein
MGTRMLLACMVGLTSIGGCGGDHPDFSHEASIEEQQWYGIGNFTVVSVEPNGSRVTLQWRGFHQRSGNALKPPWEELRISSDSEVYLITDKGIGNNELLVNGKSYKFDGASQTLVIRFGVGVSIGSGYPYAKAKHWYDAF